jgi:predicted PurR-regulated permease PerM
MDEIIVAVLIALLAGFALHDIVRFLQTFERGTIWKALLGVGLPCALLAYIVVQLGLLESTSIAAPFMRDAAIVKF